MNRAEFLQLFSMGMLGYFLAWGLTRRGGASLHGIGKMIFHRAYRSLDRSISDQLYYLAILHYRIGYKTQDFSVI